MAELTTNLIKVKGLLSFHSFTRMHSVWSWTDPTRTRREKRISSQVDESFNDEASQVAQYEMENVTGKVSSEALWNLEF